MSSIESNDRYRIEKSLHIYLESKQVPSVYFKEHHPLPTITSSLPMYQIEWERALLRERIALRTQEMAEEGLIDEICYLEKTYGRKPNCMKAIGDQRVFSLSGRYLL